MPIDRTYQQLACTLRDCEQLISDLENKIGKTIPIEEVVKSAAEKNINAEKVDEVIERLKRSGDLFEPRRGFIQRI